MVVNDFFCQDRVGTKAMKKVEEKGRFLQGGREPHPVVAGGGPVARGGSGGGGMDHKGADGSKEFGLSSGHEARP
jgi:hypothetical protein